MTRQNWWTNVGGVVLVLTLGWIPVADAAARPSAGGRSQAGGDITYSLRPETDGSFVLAASSSEVSMRKAIYEDGHSVTVIERGQDRVTIATSGAGVVVTRNGRSATVGTDARDDKPWVRVRALLAGSPAVRAFRALSNALETSPTDNPEQMGVRLSGALVAQLDGDEGAPARLARELKARYGGRLRRARATGPDCWAIYQEGVMKAARDFELCLTPISAWNPMRQVCAFVWTLQVEGMWFAYLSCCSVPLR